MGLGQRFNRLNILLTHTYLHGTTITRWGDLLSCSKGFGQKLWSIEKDCHSYFPEAAITSHLRHSQSPNTSHISSLKLGPAQHSSQLSHYTGESTYSKQVNTQSLKDMNTRGHTTKHTNIHTEINIQSPKHNTKHKETPNIFFKPELGQVFNRLFMSISSQVRSCIDVSSQGSVAWESLEINLHPKRSWFCTFSGIIGS